MKRIIFCTLLCGLNLVTFSQDDRPLLPEKIAEAPVIDRVLDEAVWAKAPMISGFKTFSPDFGLDMSQKTNVFMLYDEENLYFAFECFDDEVNRIKASVNARDNIQDDDWICINLDSFNDHQSLYAFYVNPHGI